MRRAIMLTILLAVAACAARSVTPVAMSQPGDAARDCTGLDSAIAQANAQAASYAKQDAGVAARNVVAAIILVPGVDLTREEQIQARAWTDRARYLSQLKARKQC